MSEEYCHDCGQYYIKSTGLNYHFGCNVKRDKDYRCCDCWWSKAEIARLKAENAELKALLIERVKPDFPKGAELTSFTISDSNTGEVIDVLGGNTALYAKLDDPKPQGEE